MAKNLRPMLVACCGLIVACGATLAYPATDSVNIPLVATTLNTGRIGQATLVPAGNKTEVILFFSEVPSTVASPVHLNAYIYPGTCGNLGAKPAYALNERRILDKFTPMQMWRSASVPLDVLRSNDNAVVIRTSAEDGVSEIFCGNLRRAA
jgi:hypothetical protein